VLFHITLDIRDKITQPWRISGEQWMADAPGFSCLVSFHCEAYGTSENLRIGVGLTPAGTLHLPEGVTLPSALAESIALAVRENQGVLCNGPVDVLVYHSPLFDEEDVIKMVMAKKVLDRGPLHHARTEWGEALLVRRNVLLREAVEIGRALQGSELWVIATATRQAHTNEVPNG